MGPVLANIFMVKLERSVIPTLMGKLKCWARYVDDTLYIRSFTYGVKTGSKIFFLDVLVIRDSSNNISTTVYRKRSNNDIYLNWESFAPDK